MEQGHIDLMRQQKPTEYITDIFIYDTISFCPYHYIYECVCVCVIIDRKSNCRHKHVDHIFLDYVALTSHPIVSVVFDNKYYFSVTNL